MNTMQNEFSQKTSSLFKERASKIPVDAIGLPTRTRRIVLSHGAKNSYEAVSIVLTSLINESGVGPKTISDTKTAIFNFINTIEEGTDDDIKRLADPREEFLSSTEGNLVEAFPAIVDLYLSQKKSKTITRDTDILNKRFGLHENKKYTLEDLGSFYDVSRERIRQIEASSINELQLVLRDNLKKQHWRLSTDIYTSYDSLVRKLQEYDWLILKQDLEQIFTERFGDILSDNYIDLFMEVSGYSKLPRSINGFRGEISEAWCITTKYDKQGIESIFQALDHIYDSAESLSFFDLTVGVKRKNRKKTNITNDSIRIALSATKDIEWNNESISVKLSRLKNASDKAYRILDISGKPLHFSKIAQEINLLSSSSDYSDSVKETNLKNQLVSDKRFTPIGRSGLWALTCWENVNNITIVQAIENILHGAGKPLKFADIKIALEKLRPDASLNSLKVYLNDQSVFSRVGKSEYALKSWRLKPVEKSKKTDSVTVLEFNEAIKAVLYKKNPVSLAELIRAVSTATSLSEVSARQRICATKGLQIAQQDGIRNKIVYCENIDELDNKNKIRTLLRDQVQQEIRSILYAQPNIPIQKADLYKEVSKNITCIRPTFYQYLDKMEGIEQYKEGNYYYAIYNHNETVEKININTTKYTDNISVLKILERPLSLLTINDVDIALFELGLIFEASIKDYLNKSKVNGSINVTTKDMSKLVCMIDCVVREKIVTKGHHLNTLREERNNRAHGNIPTMQERTDLFNKAHYIADLFVKYICFFRNNT